MKTRFLLEVDTSDEARDRCYRVPVEKRRGMAMEDPPGIPCKVFFLHRGEEGVELALLAFRELAPFPEYSTITWSRLDDQEGESPSSASIAASALAASSGVSNIRLT